MDISLQDVANIVTYVAPGYFAIWVYAHRFAKQPKDFSRLLIESVVFSLPLVAVAHLIWHHLFRQRSDSALNAGYVILVTILGLVTGLIVTALRMTPPISKLTKNLGFSHPDENFLRSLFSRLSASDAVTVTLKNGEIFSGTPKRGSLLAADGLDKYYFDNIAWFNKDTGKWNERTGGLIVDLSEVEYIATPPLKGD